MILSFITAFIPCSFEGFEMAMFASLARSMDERSALKGIIFGVLSVFLMSYAVYLALPILISDTSEWIMKYFLGFLLISLATFFIWRDYPTPKEAFLTGFLGIAIEGVETNLFEISAYLMTGNLLMAFLGGTLGFLWILILSILILRRFPKRLMRIMAIVILYVVGFIVLTSGLI
ncbi:MAG: hypothetical protein QXY68_05195 [Saccharolobus sp.]